MSPVPVTVIQDEQCILINVILLGHNFPPQSIQVQWALNALLLEVSFPYTRKNSFGKSGGEVVMPIFIWLLLSMSFFIDYYRYNFFF